MRAQVSATAPALAIQRQNVASQEKDGERKVVDQIAQIDDAALNALEAAARAELTQQVACPRAEKIGDDRRAYRLQQPADDSRPD